jgi:diaminopimelate epimerase
VLAGLGDSTVRCASQRAVLATSMLSFTKMHGAGNDFVLINNLSGAISLSKEQIAFLCDRHRGVGADGILLLEEPGQKGDFWMRYYNSDGGEAEMCGNGARCFARFASRQAGPFESLTFETPAGLIRANLNGEQVTVNLSAPHNLVLQRSIDVGGAKLTIHSINTGVPHAVVFVERVLDAPVIAWGNTIRWHAAFKPAGTNADFTEVLDRGKLQIRTYERGVEDETLACGTGVVASALIYAALHDHPGSVSVQVKSGDWLEVHYSKLEKQFQDVSLTGPAVFAFEGTIDLP